MVESPFWASCLVIGAVALTCVGIGYVVAQVGSAVCEAIEDSPLPAEKE